MTDVDAAEGEVRAAVSLLRDWIFAADVSFTDQRERLESVTGAGVLGPGVTSAETRVGGVACTALTSEDVVADRSIVYAHGGGYCIGSPSMGLALGSFLARALRATWYGVHYRLAPEHVAPAAVDDVAAVASALGGVVVGVGDSAGGGALVAAARRGAPLRALVLISPWLDLAPDPARDEVHDPLLSIPWMEACARAYSVDVADPEVSPLGGDWSVLGPVLVVSAGQDLTAPDVARLMSHAPLNVACLDEPTLWHDYALLVGAIPAADAAASRMAEHLAGATGW